MRRRCSRVGLQFSIALTWAAGASGCEVHCEKYDGCTEYRASDAPASGGSADEGEGGASGDDGEPVGTFGAASGSSASGIAPGVSGDTRVTLGMSGPGGPRGERNDGASRVAERLLHAQGG